MTDASIIPLERSALQRILSHDLHGLVMKMDDRESVGIVSVVLKDMGPIIAHDRMGLVPSMLQLAKCVATGRPIILTQPRESSLQRASVNFTAWAVRRNFINKDMGHNHSGVEIESYSINKREPEVFGVINMTKADLLDLAGQPFVESISTDWFPPEPAQTGIVHNFPQKTP